MLKTLLATAFAVTLFVGPGFVTPGFAADVPSKATAQVKSGLYVTAAEAYDLLQKDPQAVLIDVRDPIEIMFTGWTDETDIHVPYRLSDRSKFVADKGIYPMVVNKTFADQVEAKLTAMGASKETPVIFMCRSGSTRSAPAADLLFDRGWTQAYTVTDGFEGGKVADGPSKGVRAVDGWRNSGLPWTYKMDKAKMFIAAP